MCCFGRTTSALSGSKAARAARAGLGLVLYRSIDLGYTVPKVPLPHALSYA
jgi:hypothetical protein